MNKPKIFLITSSVLILCSQSYLLFSSDKPMQDAVIESMTGIAFSGEVISGETLPAESALSSDSGSEENQAVESSVPEPESESVESDVVEEPPTEEIAPQNRLLSLEDFQELLTTRTEWQWTLKLSSRGTSGERDATFKHMTGDSAEIIQDDLTDLLMVNDAPLVVYLSKIFASRQMDASIPKIVERRSLETEQWVREELLKSLLQFNPGPVSDAVINLLFSQEWLPAGNAAYFKSLQGRLSPENQDTLKEHLQSEKVSETFLNDSILLLSSCGVYSPKFSEHAISLISAENIQSKVTGLKILRFQEDTRYLDQLTEMKRQMYHTDLLEEYLKTMVVLSGINREGAEQLDAYEEAASKHQDVLAWACLQAANRKMDSYIKWILAMGSKYNLGQHPDFLKALNLCDITIEEWQQNADTLNEKGDKSAGSAYILLPENVPDVAIFIGNKALDMSQSEHKIPAGMRTVKCQMGNHSTEVQLDFKDGFNYPLSIDLVKAGDEFTNSIGMKLKVIPEGTFFKGSQALNIPLREIHLSLPLMVGIFEVTNQELEAVDSSYKSKRDRRALEDQQPAINMTWFEAVKFCNQLSALEKHSPVYDEFYNINHLSYGYRLLTESEWEYAALTGKKADELKPEDYYFGQNVYKANFYPSPSNADGHTFTAKAGSFPANAFGLYDMIGNVNEWCHDYYSETYYSKDSTPMKDPFGPDSGKERLIKGGSWQSRADKLNPAYREFIHPNLRSNTRGFRVCKRFNPLSISFKEEARVENVDI